ncbi:MAG TPA: tetratricopeptide repeat protein, partial [Blastocatellia bacterium]|nr:tetratricopeptide repeat protein [Blastocatellia bacterium]
MLNRGIIRLLLPCGALIFALAAPASYSVFAQSPSSAQTEVPPDVKAYRAAMRLENPQQRIDALEQFLNDFPQSRYAASVPNLILDLLIKGGEAQKERILAQANRIIDNAPENGRSQACHTIAARFVVAGILLDEAEVFGAKAISTFNESKFFELQRETYRSRGRTPPPDSILLRAFNSTRATYLATLGQVYLKKGRDAEAERTFKEALKASPSLVTAMIGLATVKANAGDKAKALEIMAEVALSGRMTSAARPLLEELYRKTHQDSPDGLEDWLDEQYRRAFPNPLHVKPYKPRSSRTDRVVLAEVFTGAGCPPCVGADLAFDAALERYQRRDVAVLMYHLHIPRPDPMTNAATQARAAFYAVRGVPTYRIDGQAGGGGGSREQTSEIYDRFNPRIERQLETPSQAEIKLETALDGGIVKVRATVGKVEGQSSSLMLHLALVENILRYNGENGVRFHPMVVRDLAGPGASGFRLRATQPMTFEHAFDLARLTSDLKAQLEEYEQRNSGFKFAEKKHTLDAGALSVVAFVQDEASLHILQASHSAVKPGAMQLKAPQSELAVRPTTSASVEPKSENPITWKLRAEAPNRTLKAGDTFTVQITAQIAAGWHLYAPEQAAGGPRPTRLSLPAEQMFKLAGEVESPPPRTAFDENFGIETAFYETSATFSAPVRIAGDASEGRQQLRIQAYFQTCNDRLCLPPRTIHLASPIEIGGGKSPSENKPENKPDSRELAIPINEIGLSPGNVPAGDDAPEETSRASARNESLRQEIARLQAELRRWSNTGNARWEAETFHHLGMAHFSLGERGQALDYYQQSLKLWRTLKDRKGEGRTLNNIGWTFHSSGELRQALDYYQQALPIRRSAGDREGEIQTLYNLGRLHGELSQYEQAIAYYQQALALRQAQGD